MMSSRQVRVNTPQLVVKEPITEIVGTVVVSRQGWKCRRTHFMRQSADKKLKAFVPGSDVRHRLAGEDEIQ